MVLRMWARVAFSRVIPLQVRSELPMQVSESTMTGTQSSTFPSSITVMSSEDAEVMGNDACSRRCSTCVRTFGRMQTTTALFCDRRRACARPVCLLAVCHSLLPRFSVGMCKCPPLHSWVNESMRSACAPCWRVRTPASARLCSLLLWICLLLRTDFGVNSNFSFVCNADVD